MKQNLPLPAVIGAVVTLVVVVVWFGFKVMNQSQEGVTPPGDAHRMMMEYMKRGGTPGQAGTGASKGGTAKP
jgi:hypothetical protein